MSVSPTGRTVACSRYWVAAFLRLLGLGLCIYWGYSLVDGLVGLAGFAAGSGPFAGSARGAVSALMIWSLVGGPLMMLVPAGALMLSAEWVTAKLLPVSGSHCVKCGYSRRGLVSNTPCPECGTRVD